jgi:putative ABC transport system permease protein
MSSVPAMNRLINELSQDIRYGIRILTRNPGFSLICILTLAVGIGANTAVFSVVYGVLFRPLAYFNPDQLVVLYEVNEKGTRMYFADPMFNDVREQSSSLQGVAEYAGGISSVFSGHQATRVMVSEVSKDFFKVMGVQPVFGRGFSKTEQQVGSAPVALISFAYWRQTLAADKDWSNIKLIVQNRAVPIVGVLPPGFAYPANTDIWVTREAIEEPLSSRTAHNWPVIARLRDGVSLAESQAELSGIAQRAKQQYGSETDTADISVRTLSAAITGSVRTVLWVSFAAVGFLLLVSCTNAVNLLLAHVSKRQEELAVRAALGASRKRLVRQFLTESLLLAFCGGGLGIAVAFWSVGAIVTAAPRSVPRVEGVSVNLPSLLFSIGISALVAAVLGVTTALGSTSGNLQSVLIEGSRGHTGNRGQKLRKFILAIQVATTVVLMVGAGLLGRSLLRVLSIDPGFRTEQVLAMDLSLSPTSQPSDSVHRIEFLNTLFERLRHIPGVGDVGGSIGLPLTGGLYNGNYAVLNNLEAVPQAAELSRLFQDPVRTGSAEYCIASEGFFKVLDIPLLQGRLFDDHDTIDAPHVAVISESIVRQKWPHENPLGHAIEFGNMDGDLRPLIIIGVVKDIRQTALESAPRPTIYVNYRQRPKRTSKFTVVLRTNVAPPAVISPVREILRGLDPSVAPNFNVFTQVVAASTKVRRFNALVVGFFAVTSLVLTMLGIYGVMSYSVTQRTREIGIRMAMGASASSIMKLVIYQSMLITAAGLLMGLIVSSFLVRTMAALLFEVTVTDSVTSAGVGLLIFLVTLAATYIPAKRAMRVDPLVALRSE